jgi:ubiquitin carboxyl-terminal hydrolase 5/13
MPGKFDYVSLLLSWLLTHLNSHYVAFIRKILGNDADKASWVLFNDEKVVQVVDVEEMKKFAYVYFFKRTSS